MFLKSQFFGYLLGNTEPALFAACVVVAAIGIFLVLLTGTRLRDKTSDTSSPQKFSWSYLWSDNAKRIYSSVIATLLTLRFAPELLGFDLTPFHALGIGLAWDGLALLIKQKTAILDPKAKSDGS